jgi:hypothetical protein
MRAYWRLPHRAKAEKVSSIQCLLPLPSSFSLFLTCLQIAKCSRQRRCRSILYSIQCILKWRHLLVILAPLIFPPNIHHTHSKSSSPRYSIHYSDLGMDLDPRMQSWAIAIAITLYPLIATKGQTEINHLKSFKNEYLAWKQSTHIIFETFIYLLVKKFPMESTYLD